MEKEILLPLLIECATIAKEVEKELTQEDVIIKEDLSPVTVGDFLLQIIINQYLSIHFPHDPIMGEEDESFLSTHPLVKQRVLAFLKKWRPQLTVNEVFNLLSKSKYGGGGRFWTVDPIDGTRGFIHKEQYAIAIALVDQGDILLGGLSCPKLQGKGCILIGEKNKGSFAYHLPSKERLQMPLTIPDKVTYCEQHLPSKTHSHALASRIVNSMHKKVSNIHLDSQCKYALVALNEVDIYLRVPVNKGVSEKLWDHAPGVIIVEEAGGIVSDLRGKKLDFSQGRNLYDNLGVIATTKSLHPLLIEGATQVLSDGR